MKTNIGDIDRIVRVVIGGAMLLLFFYGPHSPWALLGLVPWFTAVVGYCPLYGALGISTYPFDRSAKGT